MRSKFDRVWIFDLWHDRALKFEWLLSKAPRNLCSNRYDIFRRLVFRMDIKCPSQSIRLDDGPTYFGLLGIAAQA
jgi:hypothetical protein